MDKTSTSIRPTGTGQVEGDGKEMPNRGTSTGVTDTYGADLSQGATNRIRGIRGSTQSDPPGECVNADPVFGERDDDDRKDNY